MDNSQFQNLEHFYQCDVFLNFRIRYYKMKKSISYTFTILIWCYSIHVNYSYCLNNFKNVDNICENQQMIIASILIIYE